VNPPVSSFIPAQTALQSQLAVARSLPLADIETWGRQQRSPIAFENTVTFLYPGTAQTQQVELAGELTGWHSRGLRLQRTPNHLFHLTLELPRDGRLEYKFLVDGEWEQDPWNPQRIENGIGGLNSAYAMPDYIWDPLTERNPDVATGQVLHQRLDGKTLPGPRMLHIYLPPGYADQPERRYPVLYAHDGGDYITRGKLPTILDNLIAQGRIQPIIAVCIDPRDRYREYTMNPDYCKLLVEEIVPLVDSTWRTQPQAPARTLLGSSLGGLISTYMAYHYSHVFGQVFGQSSSYQFFGERMVNTLRDLPAHPLRLYLSSGRFEGLLRANRRMTEVLDAKGYTYKYDEYHEGHNWTHWCQRLSKGLEYLFAP
jgi:enterochelin esterase-like enzyme